MCGLFGVAGRDLSESLVHRALVARDSLFHRGPDQAGDWQDSCVYIGHRRLSILDLSESGRQPMVSENQDVVIAVNGEIYNFKALRYELEQAGARFLSSSDSEVILHGYRIWGVERLIDKIDGMYAISIYDLKNRKIFFIRDRAGIKPLFYAHHQGRLVWASELKAITKFMGDDLPSIDNSAIYDFLTYSYIPSPKTAYKTISKLPPSSVLEYDLNHDHVRIRRYWFVPEEEVELSPQEAAEKLRLLLKESVSEQLCSDVPVGVFLSGGVDSSIITAIASSLSPGLETFSIGFGVSGCDETGFARSVSEAFGTNHHSHTITPSLDHGFAEWLLGIYDEPLSTNSALPMWYVSKFARERVTVALGGDGGDELFGGYKWYAKDGAKIALFKFLAKFPEKIWEMPIPRRKGIRHYARAVRGETDRLAIHNNLYFTKIFGEHKKYYRSLLEIPADYDDMWFFRPYYRPDLGPRKWRQYLDFHCFLPEMVLTKVDRATMSHGLEARVPFLSRPLIEFAFSLPESFLYKNGDLKGGLKWTFSDILPDVILSRGKQGFSLPWDAWRQDLIGCQGNLQDALFDGFYKA